MKYSSGKNVLLFLMYKYVPTYMNETFGRDFLPEKVLVEKKNQQEKEINVVPKPPALSLRSIIYKNQSPYQHYLHSVQ